MSYKNEPTNKHDAVKETKFCREAAVSTGVQDFLLLNNRIWLSSEDLAQWPTTNSTQ